MLLTGGNVKIRSIEERRTLLFRGMDLMKEGYTRSKAEKELGLTYGALKNYATACGVELPFSEKSAKLSERMKQIHADKRKLPTPTKILFNDEEIPSNETISLIIMKGNSTRLHEISKSIALILGGTNGN
jgi:hypothetical protein